MQIRKGFLAINKPKDWTSFDVVNKIRHLTKIKRVGHLGTLDPMATGVLLVATDKATKLFDLLQEKKKTYVATFQFGLLTDSLDITGKILKTDSKIVGLEGIKSVLPKFIGKISQMPPKFSAKSVDGVRAYDLARKGVDFELKPKEVEIFDIKILEFKNNILKTKITCGSGTYIRSIGRDLGELLGTCATMTSLVRTKVGDFDLSDTVDIENLTAENVFDYIHKIDEILNCPILNLNQIETAKVLNGQSLPCEKESGIYKLNNEIDTIAIVKVKNNLAKMQIFLG